jgi:DNA polymerase III delta prime subunit
VFVLTSRHREAVDALQRLLRASGTSGTHKGLALIGPTGVGKTATVRHVERWLRKELKLEPHAPSPLPMVLLTTNTTGRSLSQNVAAAGGDPLAGSGTQSDAELRMQRSAPYMTCIGFALDEFHHAFAHKNAAEAGRMAMTLKTMVNSLQRPIIAIGTNGLEEFIDANSELKQRFQRKIYLDDPRITSATDVLDLRQLLEAMQAELPIQADFRIDSRAMLIRLMVAAGGQFGSVVDLVRRACEFGADKCLPGLTVDCLSSAYRESAPRAQRSAEHDPFLQPLELVTRRAAQIDLPRVPRMAVP